MSNQNHSSGRQQFAMSVSPTATSNNTNNSSHGPSSGGPSPQPKKSKRIASDNVSEAAVIRRTVHINFLPLSMPQEMLLATLEGIGRVRRIRICRDPNKDPSKDPHSWIFGFAEFFEEADANRCKEHPGISFKKMMVKFSAARQAIQDTLPHDADFAKSGRASLGTTKVKNPTIEHFVAQAAQFAKAAAANAAMAREGGANSSSLGVGGSLPDSAGNTSPPQRQQGSTPVTQPGSGNKVPGGGPGADISPNNNNNNGNNGNNGAKPQDSAANNKPGSKQRAADSNLPKRKAQEFLNACMATGMQYQSTRVVSHYYSCSRSLESLGDSTNYIAEINWRGRLQTAAALITFAVEVMRDDAPTVTKAGMEVIDLVQEDPVPLVESRVLSHLREKQQHHHAASPSLRNDFSSPHAEEAAELNSAVQEAEQALSSAIEDEAVRVNTLIACGMIAEDGYPILARTFYALAQKRAALGLDDSNAYLDACLEAGGLPLKSVKSAVFPLCQREPFLQLFFESYKQHLESVKSAEAAGYAPEVRLPPIHVLTMFPSRRRH